MTGTVTKCGLSHVWLHKKNKSVLQVCSFQLVCCFLPRIGLFKRSSNDVFVFDMLILLYIFGRNFFVQKWNNLSNFQIFIHIFFHNTFHFFQHILNNFGHTYSYIIILTILTVGGLPFQKLSSSKNCVYLPPTPLLYTVTETFP